MAGKLIAKRPIQYQGRLYQRGEAVPSSDPVMTAAWLRADSAAWEEAPEKREPSPSQGTARAERKGRKR